MEFRWLMSLVTRLSRSQAALHAVWRLWEHWNLSANKNRVSNFPKFGTRQSPISRIAWLQHHLVARLISQLKSINMDTTSLDKNMRNKSSIPLDSSFHTVSIYNWMNSLHGISKYTILTTPTIVHVDQ
jgi:hypothetical protein